MTAIALSVSAAAEATDCSTDTIRKAMNKWRAGVDDGTFPPPLQAKKKGDGARAALVTRDDWLRDWIDRWPDPETPAA